MDQKIAADWVAGLRARGVGLTLRGPGTGRLWLHPAKAYYGLTDAELLILRHHREAIKDLVRSGYEPPPATRAAAPRPGTPPEPAPAPEPEKPEVPEHIRRILEWNSPAERARRDKEASDVMFAMARRRKT